MGCQRAWIPLFWRPSGDFGDPGGPGQPWATAQLPYTVLWAGFLSSIRTKTRARLNLRPWVGRRHPAHGDRDLRDGPGGAGSRVS
eukprot:gene23969-biopygen23868